jgi:hypothetical protein
MSLVTSIKEGLVSVKEALGDLVVTAVLKTNPVSSYDVGSGQNVTFYTDTVIEYFVETFSEVELEGHLIKEDDLKISVFNTSSSLNIMNNDKILINDTLYEVYKVRKLFVSGSYPMITVYLKV